MFPGKPHRSTSDGKMSTNSTGFDTVLGDNPGAINSSGTLNATSKLLYFAHRPFSPRDHPVNKDINYVDDIFSAASRFVIETELP